MKYGFTKRILVFKEIGRTEVKVQHYSCKRCGKTFQTDLLDLVDKNNNFKRIEKGIRTFNFRLFGNPENVFKSFK